MGACSLVFPAMKNNDGDLCAKREAGKRLYRLPASLFARAHFAQSELGEPGLC